MEDTTVDPKKEIIVQKEERTRYIDNLLPKTIYSFNISAKFIDGSWGPPYSMQAETSMEGEHYEDGWIF